MDFFIEFVVGVVFTAYAVYLVMRYMERKIMAEIEKLAETLESTEPTNIVATVEVADNQYFCYNKDNSQFLCYGSTLAELVTRFRNRFPNYNVTLESEDRAVADELYRQYQQTKD